MQKRKGHFFSLTAGLVFLFVLGMGTKGFGYRMVPMNLEEMVAKADRIMIGVCESRSEGEMEVGKKGQPIHYTEYTFQVTDAIKGNLGQTLTIRQVRFGGSPNPKNSNGNQVQAESALTFNPLPLPEYQEGKEVLLFLGADSIYGFTSPIAMEQAVFDVKMDQGKKGFSNRLSNQLIFEGISIESLSASKKLSAAEMAIFPKGEKGAKVEGQKTPVPFPYEPFVSLIRKLANGN
ncbi:MAG TPA: hypothetical protein VGB26_00065 [Nitrospiria bacterium]|jgi:hypothetical protein